MINKQLGPCPIPNCALEYFLAAVLLAVAVSLLTVGSDTAVAQSLAIDHNRISRLQWSLYLGAPGLAQLLSLWTSNRGLHRLMAFICLVVCLLFTNFLLVGNALPILAGVFIVLTIGESYVFLMLRGAVWSFSRNSSTVSRPSGSSAAR